MQGDHWDGAGLDVETHNGGVRLTLPATYSAELETGTTNGRISIDFPVTVQGRIDRHLTATLGAGGPKDRAITTNGGGTSRRRERPSESAASLTSLFWTSENCQR